MYLLKIILSLLIYLFLFFNYFLVLIIFNSKNGTIFFLIISAIIIIYIFLCFKGLIKKAFKIKLFKKNGTINKPLIALLVLISMCFSQYVISVVLKDSNENISVYKLINDIDKSTKDTNDYNKLFKSIKYDNNTVYYSPELEPALELVDAYLKKAAENNSKIFGNIITSPLSIKFDYDEEVFKKRSGIKDSAGLYSDINKTIHIYIEDCYSDVLGQNFNFWSFKNTLLHEYTHHMFFEFMNNNQLSKEKIPLWFIEGVAEYIGKDNDQGGLPETLLNFNELNTQKQWVNFANKSYNIYEQSHYAVSQLILIKGENVIKEILLNTKETDFNTAFNKATGFTLKDYENNFKMDFKGDWVKYDRTPSTEPAEMYIDIRTNCLEKYVQLNPNNINALLDLAQFHENSGELDKAKSTLVVAVDGIPDSSMAWRRLALIYVEMDDFDNAINTFEKVLSIKEANTNENISVSYINLSHVLMLKDMNKAVEIAQKAKKTDKSKFLNKQAQEVINFKNSIENGRPYEGCLNFIKSDTLHSSNIEKALIEKMLKDYPLIRCEARNELVKLYKQY